MRRTIFPAVPRQLYNVYTSVPPPKTQPQSNPLQFLSIITPILNLYDQRLCEINSCLRDLCNQVCVRCCGASVSRAVPPPASVRTMHSQPQQPAEVHSIPPFPPSWRNCVAGPLHRDDYSLHHLQQELQSGGWRQASNGVRSSHRDFNACTSAANSLPLHNSFGFLSKQNISDGKDGVEINIIEGSVFDSPASLVHCVGEDFTEARGVAVDFKDAFGKTDYLRSLGLSTGEVATLPIREEDYLFNLITKKKSSHKPRRANLRKCLWKLRDQCTELGVKHLAMPKIGSGYDRLSWDETEDDLRRVFAGSGIKLDIYVLPPEAAAAYAARELARTPHQQPLGPRGNPPPGQAPAGSTPPCASQPGASQPRPLQPRASQPRASQPRAPCTDPPKSAERVVLERARHTPPQLRVVGVVVPKPPVETAEVVIVETADPLATLPHNKSITPQRRDATTDPFAWTAEDDLFLSPLIATPPSGSLPKSCPSPAFSFAAPLPAKTAKATKAKPKTNPPEGFVRASKRLRKT